MLALAFRQFLPYLSTFFVPFARPYTSTHLVPHFSITCNSSSTFRDLSLFLIPTSFTLNICLNFFRFFYHWWRKYLQCQHDIIWSSVEHTLFSIRVSFSNVSPLYPFANHIFNAISISTSGFSVTCIDTSYTIYNFFGSSNISCTNNKFCLISVTLNSVLSLMTSVGYFSLV